MRRWITIVLFLVGCSMDSGAIPHAKVPGAGLFHDGGGNGSTGRVTLRRDAGTAGSGAVTHELDATMMAGAGAATAGAGGFAVPPDDAGTAGAESSDAGAAGTVADAGAGGMGGVGGGGSTSTGGAPAGTGGFGSGGAGGTGGSDAGTTPCAAGCPNGYVCLYSAIDRSYHCAQQP